MEEKVYKGSRVKLTVGIIAIAVVLAVILFFTVTRFVTDWMWFSEVGYVDVFFKELFTKLTVGIPAFVIITLLAKLYLGHLKKSYFASVDSTEIVNTKKLSVISWIIALLFAAIVTVASVTELWMRILEFTNSTDFNIADPVFGLDISFYIFKLDFLCEFNDILIGIIIGFVILTLVYYSVLLTVRTPEIFTEEPNIQQPENNAFRFRTSGKKLNKTSIRQLLGIASGKISLLGVIFFVMLAINFFLKQFELLHGHNGVVYGAGFTDVNVTLWVFRIIAVLALASAVTFVIHMKKKEYKKLIWLPLAMIAVGIIGTGAQALVQNIIVSPDEISKESAYLKNNIEYTQYAYGLDGVSVQSFAADNTLDAADIAANSETINNIRINDFEPAEQFYNQTQSIRQYYTFNDVDVDRYTVDGKYTQTFLTAREIDESRISDTWINKHLKYTHGYGAALSRVDKVTPSGQPDVLVGNIPPVSEVPEIEITRPEIYFGEMANEYIIVGTDEEEFDYPDGDSNEYTRYKGTAGIRLGLFNRIWFAAREGSLKLLVSSNINSDSRIIINRSIMQRVSEIMPYLSYENDPYMVTADGKLYWIIDAYTTSENYPYSEPFGGNVNYIRNSVKVVIDAYNGTTGFYIIDENDPVAQTYSKIYPTLFKSVSELPSGISEHFRYPDTLFEIQANVYTKYHMNDVEVFYQSEDLWDIASEIYGTEKVMLGSSYFIAKLPGESKAEFFNSIPFTPKSKQNMTALLVARNDGEHYGELVLYQFPKSKAVYGPEQVEAQIDQNTEISKEFTLWNSSGTTYRRGNMFVIPIETSILYVEPVYLEAQNSSIPEVKRIIVCYNDKIAYEETLEECLIELFGKEVNGEIPDIEPPTDEPDVTEDKPEDQDPTAEDVPPTAPDEPAGELGEMSQQELIDAASFAFESAENAQRNGDWAGYGEYIEKLGDLLEELAKRN